ncbi:hypothetical protein [Nocardia sp. NPDC051833]|uniref:hypothetical protein n=1 Tax=Nocardia sp. NPDC051833 TaxID=3155674 RepID=UPI00341AD95D
MTAEPQTGQVAPAQAPAVRETTAHTSEDHRAASPEPPAGASVAAPFHEAASLPAPSLEQEG